MVEFDAAAHLKEVLSSFNQSDDSRFKEIMTSVVTHLHTCIAELKLTPEEWISSIKFLTATGAICTDRRQEFILLSDLLGVSTLTISINQHRGEGCLEDTVEGPYYWEGAPERPLGSDISEGVTGEKAYYHGKVIDAHGKPVAGAVLDVWSGDGDGNYDMQLPDQMEMLARAKFRTDEQGNYSFWSIRPSFYPIPQDGPAGLMQSKLKRHPNRPGHIHFKISAPDFHSVNTQLFVANSPYLNSDCVFGVKPGLIVDYVQHPVGTAPDGKQMAVPYYCVPFDFRLTAV